MQTCTSINLFYDPTFRMSVKEQMQRVYDGGFRHLDMNFWDWSHDPASPFRQDNWREWVDGIADKAARMGAVFTQAHADVYNFYTEDAARREMLLRSIEGCAMLGIKWCVFHPSQRPDWAEQKDDSLVMKENIEYYKPLIEYGVKWGVGLALENMSSARTGLTTAEQLCRLVDGLSSPAAGNCWDTGHAHIAGQDQPASIRTLGHRLHALHIQDNNGERDQHTAPFYGTIDWQPIMQALKDINYDGDFTFEAHTLIRSVPEYAKAAATRLLYDIGDGLLTL